MSDEAKAEEMVSKSVHLQRLNTKITQIEQLGQQVTDLQGRLAEAEVAAAKFQEVNTTLTDLQKKHEAFVAAATTERHILAAGVADEEDIDLVKYRYQRLPADGRPELGEWLKGGARSDRHLRHLWQQEPPPAAAPPNGTSNGTNGASNGSHDTGRDGLPSVHSTARPAQIVPTQSMSLEEIMRIPMSVRNSPEGRAKIEAYLKSKSRG